MKVLMVNTPQSPNLRGGDTVQMEKTAQALRDLGVDVRTTVEAEPDARGFDLAHVFNLRTIEATERQVASLARSGVPIVMSPIYLDVSLALWGNTAVVRIFSETRSDSELAELVQKLKERTLDLEQPDGSVLRADGVNRPKPNYDDVQRRILAHVRHLLPNSVMEMSALMKTLRVTSIPFTIVPYGADAASFLNADAGPFIERFGLEDFVLQVGRIEPAKNQAMLCYAMQALDLPLVLIGHPAHRAYVEACRRLAKRSLFIAHLPQEQLASAYAAARVHALPSWVETCGLVTMEAALADCSLVLSNAGYECEYFGNYGHYCDPADPDSIREAVRKAWEHHAQEGARRRELRSLVLQNYTWQAAAEAALKAYASTLAAN